MAHFAGLLLLFNMPTLLVPVFATSSHNTISKLFKRYLDTFIHVKSWYTSDPFDLKSDSCKSIKKVNCLHRVVYKNVNNNNRTDGKIFMTQYDMVLTQWSIIGPIVLWPAKFGLYNITKEELESLVHFWKVIGYTLGIEDRFNCCLDTYEETVEFCNLMYDRDFFETTSRNVPVFPEFPLQMALGLTHAMNCFAPMLSFPGLLRYTYKYVLECPNVYVPVKNRKGYRNLVYMITVLMQYTWFHYVASYLLSFALLIINWRQKKILAHFQNKYDKDVNYQRDYQEWIETCPMAHEFVEKYT